MTEENKLILLLAAIFFVAAYIVGMIVTLSDINHVIRWQNNITEGVVSVKMTSFLMIHKNLVATVGMVLFPLYWCFVLGSIFGEKIYRTLIDNDDENRIASWLV